MERSELLNNFYHPHWVPKQPKQGTQIGHLEVESMDAFLGFLKGPHLVVLDDKIFSI